MRPSRKPEDAGPYSPRVRILLVLALLLGVPAAVAAPEQVHLGVGDGGRITVSWYSATPEPAPTVRVGGTEVEARHVPGPAAGFVYEATLPEVPAAPDLAVEVGGRSFPFRLPEETVTIAVVGDMGVTPKAQAAVEAMLAHGVDLVLHAGDVSYAEGDQVAWNAWFNMVEPVAASAPWMVAIGNHEASVAGLTRPVPNPAEQAYYRQRFAFPGNELWYSFDWGPVHVVALDTFSEVTVSQAQLDWLRADLAAADAPWTLAVLHEPPYSSNAAHGSSPRAQAAFVAILEEAGVDLVLAAHDHAYERSWPLRDGEPVVRSNESAKGAGTVYVVSGGGGASLYGEWEDPQPEWSAAREALYHVVLLDVSATELKGRVVPTEDSAFADAFTLRASPPGGVPGAVVTTADAPVGVLVAVAALALAAAFGPRRR